MVKLGMVVYFFNPIRDRCISASMLPREALSQNKRKKKEKEGRVEGNSGTDGEASFASTSSSDAKTGGAASKGRKGAKSSGTAAKVALMKLKMHADGDKSLPQVKRALC